jgi:signal peptidase I
MKRSSKRRFLLIAILALLVFSVPSYAWVYVLTGPSDAPTLLRGDKVMVNHAAYWLRLPHSQIQLLRLSHPKRGDLVLIQRPDNPARAFKRVMGLPGETIEVRDNRLIIDGRPLSLKELPRGDFAWVPASHKMGTAVFDEEGHWAAFTPGGGQFPNMAPIHLASGEYFLLGDNRDVSLDCRVWGPLGEGAILGKIVFIAHTGPRSIPPAH